ncbi:MAG: hypothetical protein IJD78_04715 [Clostridia bacterium]|nr:hypothetical protein [Clostridia bacterium]
MIKFLPFENDGISGMKAFENDAELGYCTFTLSGYDMKFEEMHCDDDIIIEGLARAAMNYAANKNAYIAKVDKALLCAAFERLGFEGDDIMTVEIPEALTTGCSCSHSKPF